MTDVIFDIDGTLADATHRLHLIKDPTFWVHLAEAKPLTPDWESFLSDEQVARDTPILHTWRILWALMDTGYRPLFITGRSETSREMTWDWLNRHDRSFDHNYNRLFMRAKGDRRPSHETKQDCLMEARSQGYNPTLVFEDRADDAAMWRRNGLLCMHVAEGNF